MNQAVKKGIPFGLILALIILSFIGFLDAVYLTVAHYSGNALNCSVLKGCDVVTTSKYSLIFGIPVALLGSFYYFIILILALLYLDTKNKSILSLILHITTIGFLMSVWFVYSQFFIIEALCQYCLLSALTSTILFILNIYISKYKKLLP